MQLIAHAPLERRVHHLVLRHAALAGELLGSNDGPIMIAVAREVVHLDKGVWKALPEEALKVYAAHGHWDLDSETLNLPILPDGVGSDGRQLVE